jgi:aryl-alcohol dehydrogenase-like predicted oxidoreductase
MLSTIIDGVGIRVSRLGFGTASLHHIFGSKKRGELLAAAIDSGITHFDTAPYYGYGLAENDLGRIISKRRSEFTVTTKVGLYPQSGFSTTSSDLWSRKLLGKILPKMSKPKKVWEVNYARSSLYGSLKRLKTDYVDFLFLHEPDLALINIEEMFDWLKVEKEKGSIRAWGLAGIAELVEPFLNSEYMLYNVIQTQDSIDSHEADFVLNAGRSLQFTYGYISSACISRQNMSVENVMQSALKRNNTGSILVSAQSSQHLYELAKMVKAK